MPGSLMQEFEMKKSLLCSVAAVALVFAGGSAFAQGSKGGEAPSSTAPKSDSAAPSRSESTAPSPKAESASPSKSSAESAQPSGSKSGTTAQDKGDQKGAKSANEMK